MGVCMTGIRKQESTGLPYHHQGLYPYSKGGDRRWGYNKYIFQVLWHFVLSGLHHIWLQICVESEKSSP